MKITLPAETLGSLAAPDSSGLVRATVALRLGEGNEVDIVEINDSPVAMTDDDNPMPSEDLPDLNKADIY